MARKRPVATVRQFVYLHGHSGEYVNVDDLTPEEFQYMKDMVLYKDARFQCEQLSRELGYTVELDSEPPKPVGRFAEAAAKAAAEAQR